MQLKLQEHIKHISFAFEEIKPRKATVGINETDIIFMTTDRCLGRAPYVEKHKL